MDCLKKTQEFHTFHQSVKIAQEEYLRRIVKSEAVNEIESHSLDIAEQPDFVEVMTNVDMLNEFIDEYTSKPDEEDEEREANVIDIEPQLEDITFNDPPIIENADCTEIDEQHSGKITIMAFISNKIALKCSTAFRTRNKLRGCWQ